MKYEVAIIDSFGGIVWKWSSSRNAYRILKENNAVSVQVYDKNKTLVSIAKRERCGIIVRGSSR